jgi:hypothetical protein
MTGSLFADSGIIFWSVLLVVAVDDDDVTERVPARSVAAFWTGDVLLCSFGVCSSKHNTGRFSFEKFAPSALAFVMFPCAQEITRSTSHSATITHENGQQLLLHLTI